MKNPLDGILPDFAIFGAEFTTIWQKLAAGLWGLGLIIAVGYLAHGILGIASNRSGGHPGQLRESRKEFQNAGIAFGGLIALPVIVGAFLLIFGG